MSPFPTAMRALSETNATTTEELIMANTLAIAANGHDMDVIWFMFAGCLVFLMQAGFSMLEAGCVSAKNTVNILFKNVLDACVGALFYYFIGSGFAYGAWEDGENSFIGSPGVYSSNFMPGQAEEGVEDDDGFTLFYDQFFAFTFAATAATIVSGAVAERCQFSAYFVYSVVITTFIYPVVVHWGWDGTGLLVKMGYVDFAGSGIVHMVGGFAGLVGAICLGPRIGRFDAEGKVVDKPGHSMVLASLGVAILWFGWYGFNCGSTLGAVGAMDLAGRVAITTTMSAASCCVTCTWIVKLMTGKFDLGAALNGILAGLVSITAGCATTSPASAVFIGIIGAPVYIFSSKLLLKLKIDDPLDACPIHGFCGIWGVLAVAIFAGIDSDTFYEGGYSDPPDMPLFGVQAVGVLLILVWTVATSALIFVPLKMMGALRVSAEVEESGLDLSEHGGASYNMGDVTYANKGGDSTKVVPT